MLPKSHRLARPDFLQTKKLGKSFSTPHFSAIVYNRILNTEHRTPGRFAIVTSTKLSKSAVIRNRLRRQIYNSLEIKNLKLEIDLIIFPRSSMLKFTYAETSSEINSFLSKISQSPSGK